MNARLLILVGLLAMQPICAHAQRVLQTFVPGTSVISSNFLNNLQTSKADAVGGTLNAPSIVGSTLSGGTTINGAGDLAFVPKGSPIAGSRGSIVRQITMNHTGFQEYGDNTECTSYGVAPSLGGNVCHYTWMEVTSQSGGGWAGNWITQLDAGFKTSTYTTIIGEFDINNLAGPYGPFGVANGLGLLLNGIGYQMTAAVSIQTGNTAAFDPGGQLALWYLGLHCDTNAVRQACIHDGGSSWAALWANGANTYGIDLADDNTAGGAIRVGYLGATQGIVGRNGSVTRSLLYMTPDGMMHLGSIAYPQVTIDGSLYPVADASYSLGSATQRWTGLWVQTINGVPAPGISTFAKMPACTSSNIAQPWYVTDGRKSGEAAGAGTGVQTICTLTAQGATTGSWEALALQGVVAN